MSEPVRVSLVGSPDDRRCRRHGHRPEKSAAENEGKSHGGISASCRVGLRIDQPHECDHDRECARCGFARVPPAGERRFDSKDHDETQTFQVTYCCK